MSEVTLYGTRAELHIHSRLSDHAVQSVLAEGGVPGVPHLQENAPPLGPYRRPMPSGLGGSWGGGVLMGEVPL